MPISIIYAQPGHGKSYYGAITIQRVLGRKSQEEFKKKYGFYRGVASNIRYTGPDPFNCFQYIPFESQTTLQILQIIHNKAYYGFYFVMDECTDFFSSYGNLKKGSPVIDSLKKHRHRGQDYMLVTQGLSMVHEHIRQLTERVGCVTNFRKHPVMGMFSLPLFAVRWYMLDSKGMNPVFQSASWMIFNKNISKLYNSAQYAEGGILVNDDPTIKKSFFGRPVIWMMLLFVFVVLRGGIAAVKMARDELGAFIDPQKDKKKDAKTAPGEVVASKSHSFIQGNPTNRPVMLHRRGSPVFFKTGVYDKLNMSEGRSTASVPRLGGGQSP